VAVDVGEPQLRPAKKLLDCDDRHGCSRHGEHGRAQISEKAMHAHSQ